jgi:DegV family protein with EDD domain
MTASPVVHGIVTDSSSQITDDLVDRFAVEVVPLVVTIDGTDHLERDELDADAFYAHFDDGHVPAISTSQPSPGAFAAAYGRLAARGCTEIWSVHIAEAMSGTVGSARLAARDAAVPVHVIDTGSASFGVSVCVWATASALDRGANADDVRRRVDGLVERLGTAFMVGVPHLTERGGRAAGVALDGDGIPILAMNAGNLELLDRVSTVQDTIDVMSAYARSWAEREPDGITVAIGTADAPSRPLGERLDSAVRDLPGVDDVIHYRIGPSVGAHTGPGTFGLFVFPTIR